MPTHKFKIGLKRESALARRRRIAMAKKPFSTARAATSASGPTGPKQAMFSWWDVATVFRVKQPIAAIRGWAYGAIGQSRGKIHRLAAKLETAVLNRNLERAELATVTEQRQTFRARIKDHCSEGELHRTPSVWNRACFGCCVAFSTLTLATPVQALGVGIDLGPHHAQLSQQLGNLLAWMAAFTFGWITCSLGKTLGAAPVNWAARNIVKDARVGLPYFWLIPGFGLAALIGSLCASAVVRSGQLKLIGQGSAIPTWSFALFTVTIESAAIVLGWATATPIADAERRLRRAQTIAEDGVRAAGEVVDALIGEVASLVAEHDALVLFAGELERGQFANAAEEIAIRAAANPSFYGLEDHLGIAAKAMSDDPAKPLASYPVMSKVVGSATSDPKVDNYLRDHIGAVLPEHVSDNGKPPHEPLPK
jgi:hypothetical protein